MKHDSDRSQTDSLRGMLTDDAAHLPVMAARAAREHRARRTQNYRRLAQASVLVLLGMCAWQGVQWTAPQRKGDRLESFVRVQTVEEAMTRPLPPPPRATEDQKALLDSARGLPLLVVMDPSGNPARIVVVER